MKEWGWREKNLLQLRYWLEKNQQGFFVPPPLFGRKKTMTSASLDLLMLRNENDQSGIFIFQ